MIDCETYLGVKVSDGRQFQPPGGVTLDTVSIYGRRDSSLIEVPVVYFETEESTGKRWGYVVPLEKVERLWFLVDDDVDDQGVTPIETGPLLGPS